MSKNKLETAIEMLKDVETSNLRVVSCIPEQKYSTDSKFQQMEDYIREYSPDLLVMPQEYFGGIQTKLFPTSAPSTYSEPEVLEPVSRLAIKYNVAIGVGALIWDDPATIERYYIVDSHGVLAGYFDKTHLPGYDHIGNIAKGSMGVSPNNDLSTRARSVEILGGIKVTVLFCWEVYSNYVWHALRRAEPDIVLNVIKFGAKGYPKKGAGGALVEGFGFGGDGGWVDRLKFGVLYDVACPIITSTNSWDQPNKAGALCGTLLPWEEPEFDRVSSLYDTSYQEEKVRGYLSQKMDPKVIFEELDYLYWRYVKQGKFKVLQELGEPMGNKGYEYTMLWKIRRMERRALK